MMEYRIMAYFSSVYTPRSYKGRVYTSYEDALKDFEEARTYYGSYNYLLTVQIEGRKVGKWKKTDLTK